MFRLVVATTVMLQPAETEGDIFSWDPADITISRLTEEQYEILLPILRYKQGEPRHVGGRAQLRGYL